MVQEIVSDNSSLIENFYSIIKELDDIIFNISVDNFTQKIDILLYKLLNIESRLYDKNNNIFVSNELSKKLYTYVMLCKSMRGFYYRDDIRIIISMKKNYWKLYVIVILHLIIYILLLCSVYIKFENNIY